MGLTDFFRRVVGRMFPKQNLEKKLNVQIATSGVMDNAISLWLQMYQNKPPWLGGEEDIRSMNLSAAIAEEFARLVLTEFEFSLDGSQRATFINDQFKSYMSNFSNIVEMWEALGGIVVKPYVSGSDEVTGRPDRIMLDFVQANRFYPTSFNSNKEITGAVFVDTKRVGDYLYTRLEHHNLEGSHYTVVNKAYRSERINTMTTEDDQISVEHPFMTEIPLDSVEEWAGLAPIAEMDGIERPFFVYVKMPRANNIDPQSPLGISSYARATDVIREADIQYSRILWEYEAKEAAIEAAEDLFDQDKFGNPILPRGKERIYRTYDFEGKNNNGFIEPYSPDIRDSSMFKGLDELLRKIEFLVGLAYGTLSNPNQVDRTATEIKSSKQRSYVTVNKMQKAWDEALEEIIQVMDTLCTLYGMCPAGVVEKTCTWGDGVLEDTDAEYQRRWSMVLAGKYKIEKFYAWYFGCTEEEAKEYIPEQPTYPPEE
jgi:A118 family predicted phage portal protein